MGGINVWDNNVALSSGGFVHEVVHMNLQMMFFCLVEARGLKILVR